MRLLVIFAMAIGLMACSAASPVPTTEKDIAAEAELLIRYSLTERLIRDTENYYRKQINAMYAAQDESETVSMVVEEELKNVAEIEHQRLIDNLVPIYMRMFTADEIHQLLSFYKTDVAAKSVKVSPQIAAESQQYVRVWAENFGNQLFKRIDPRLTEAGISIDR